MASIEKIKKLRESTQASITDCKKALEESDGDLEEAKEALHKMGLKVAEEKEEREAKDGVVGVYVHPDNKVAGMVKLYCETDFVARTDDFKDLAHEIALQVAGLDPEDEEDLLDVDLEKLKDNGEIKLVKIIAQFPREIKDTADNDSPHRIAKYALDLASEFNQFYRDYPVLQSSNKKEQRLALVKASKIALRNVLDTLGIEAPTSM